MNLTLEQKIDLAEKLAKEATDNMEINDLLDYFYTSQFDYYMAQENKLLLKEAKDLGIDK